MLAAVNLQSLAIKFVQRLQELAGAVVDAGLARMGVF
jgi:hypothetical protein